MAALPLLSTVRFLARSLSLSPHKHQCHSASASPLQVHAIVKWRRFSSATSGYFEYDEKDLKSDKSLWALYKRWMIHHGVSRDPTQQQARFKIFKSRAKSIYKAHQQPSRLCTFGVKDERDLKSDKTLWPLYKRWMRCMSRFGTSRDPTQEQARFKIFKRMAKTAYKLNQQPGRLYTPRLNLFADREFHEMPCGFQIPPDFMKWYKPGRLYTGDEVTCDFLKRNQPGRLDKGGSNEFGDRAKH